MKNGQGHFDSSIDESILNSEIYQIYCQAEDSHTAMQQIKEHKNCVFFELEKQPFLIPEEEFKSMCKNTLSNLWIQVPGLPLATKFKFDRLKQFIDGTIKHEVLGRSGDGSKLSAADSRHRSSDMQQVLQYMTKIQILNPNGYEYFYVANFKLGHPRGWERRNGNNLFTKWYRSESYELGKAQRLAQLHVFGITDSTLDQLQFNYYLTKNLTNIKWSDFAQQIINENLDDDCLIRKGPFGREGMPNFIVEN